MRESLEEYIAGRLKAIASGAVGGRGRKMESVDVDEEIQEPEDKSKKPSKPAKVKVEAVPQLPTFCAREFGPHSHPIQRRRFLSMG